MLDRMASESTGSIPDRRPQRATLVEVAALAGVSRSTASRVLSGHEAVSPDARDRVKKAAATLGYRVNRAARGLRTRRTMLVGLVLNNLVNATFHVVAEVLQRHLAQHGYRVILCVTGADVATEADYLDTIAEQEADGIVIIGTGHNTARLQTLANSGTAIVSLIRAAEEAPGDHVLAADTAGGQLATRHLIELGHTRIGYIGGRLDANSGRERLAGYTTALLEAGIAPADELIRQGPFREEFGQEAITHLLELPQRPTAIYVANHEASLRVLPTLRDLGIKVPDDLSVVCHEEAPWFRYWAPAITFIDNGATQLAELAADRLLTAMTETEPNADGHTYRVDARLVLRQSTATC